MKGPFLSHGEPQQRTFSEEYAQNAEIGKRALKVTQILADEPHIDFKRAGGDHGPRVPDSAADQAGEHAGNFLFVELGEGRHEVTAESTLYRDAMRVRFESFARDCLGSQKPDEKAVKAQMPDAVGIA